MIIHRLIAHHLKHGDDAEFYQIQARDSIKWLKQQGVTLSSTTRVLDLGCGHGRFGESLASEGCQITYADQSKDLAPHLQTAPFVQIDLDTDSFEALGQHDLVICSNVLEHLSQPKRFLKNCRQILSPSGRLYLSWTNWLSPWGGHDFSPFHYLGPHTGHKVHDRLLGKKRIHTPFETLYPTYIGKLLRQIDGLPGLQVIQTVPRYYSELGFLMKIPILREFTAWNCAMLIQRTEESSP